MSVRSGDSAVDRDWEPDTPCSEGATGELFGLIRQALLDEIEVRVDVVRPSRRSTHGDRTNALCLDLQHKAGDWMRIGIAFDPPRDYLDWRDFDTIVGCRIGERAYSVSLPATRVRVREVW